MAKNNDKIQPWKVVAFVLAAALAVFSFTYGVTSLGRKESGYHTVEVRTEDQAEVFDSGLTFTYYAEGSSNEIKHILNAVKDAYSDALTTNHKLLEPAKTYPDCVNLASVNEAMGEPVQITRPLFNILRDAYEKTLERNGFNMFAGALFSEWQTLLYLENPEEFDPLNDENERNRIRDIAEITRNLDHFSFEILDEEKCVIRFDVSEEYLSFLKEYEIASPVLNLGMMRDAYLLQAVGEEMAQKGFVNGYLTTQTGLVLSLEEGKAQELCVYGSKNGKIGEIGSVSMVSPVCGAQFVAVPPLENAYGYYEMVKDGKTFYRHPFFDGANGEFQNLLFSLELVGENAAQLRYHQLNLHTVKTQEEADAYLRENRICACYTLQKDDLPILYVSPDCAGAVQTVEGVRCVTGGAQESAE